MFKLFYNVKLKSNIKNIPTNENNINIKILEIIDN